MKTLYILLLSCVCCFAQQQNQVLNPFTNGVPFNATSATIQTFTNSITPNMNVGAICVDNGTGAITVNAPTGTTYDGQPLVIRINKNGARAITWATNYVDAVVKPTATLDATLYIKFMKNNNINAWDCVGVIQK